MGLSQSDALNLERELSRFRDPKSDLVGLRAFSVGKDCDNGVLFTATALVLMAGFNLREYSERFRKSALLVTLEDGVLARYPGETEPSSWDDHLGAAVAGAVRGVPDLTRLIAMHGYASDWTWGENWLGRIPLFSPVVRAAAGDKLSLLSRLRVAGCYLQNCFEPKGETSGICLLYLASHVLEGQGLAVAAAIELWRKILRRRYPGGKREVYGIYFGASHPFAHYSPTDFDTVPIMFEQPTDNSQMEAPL